MISFFNTGAKVQLLIHNSQFTIHNFSLLSGMSQPF